MENQPVEDAQSVKITWRIKEFSRLSMMKLYSSTYDLGGVKWEVMISLILMQVVYHMPTSVNDEPSTSIPLALQSLFYKLQYSESSVATKDLTRSFRWDTHDAFLQYDVHELNRVLCEKLQEKMKRTVVEGAIQNLFEGHHKNYIECINVDYKSCRQESFYADVQLDVKGCHDVYASFDKYVAIEHLDADNKYHAGKYGLQDAKKGVLFIDFPPVLQLHLKRFEYECIRDGMVKINKRYEFPLELDLDRDNGKYLSPEANRRVRNLYTLHSVLVHSGGVHSGHYYAFIRPTLSNQWYKFDDERVTKEDITKALDELYGGEEEERLKREQKEKELKRKEKAEADMYMIVKVVTDEDFARQIGNGICFDLVDHVKVRSFRVQKLTPFHTFK
ncbi:UNVERIFIED_CONTAM: Ubiquitin carboxyl-terminal hydrolase 12, partial [Sesamum angustifolium]